MFHITHVHSPESCPYHDPGKVRATFGKMLNSAESLGVTLVGAWVNAPAHTIYIVTETDSSQKLEEMLRPAFEIGRAETRVVGNALALLKRRTE